MSLEGSTGRETNKDKKGEISEESVFASAGLRSEKPTFEGSRFSFSTEKAT